MKKLWLGVIILAGLCVLCVGVLGLLHAKSGETLAYLARAQNARLVGNRDEAALLSGYALQSWENNAGFIDIVMSHEETDDIRREFADLLIYARAEEAEEFYSSCAKLIVMVNHLFLMERPSLRNIL